MAAIPAALFLGWVFASGDIMRVSLGIPPQVTGVVNGLVLLSLICAEPFIRLKLVRREASGVPRPTVAEKIAVEIRDACHWYAEHPLVGEMEPRLGASVRRFTHKRWIIFYRPEPLGIGIVRVVDGARDFDRLSVRQCCHDHCVR